jgi:uncharacterized protein YndB with AHSA1/START domain
MGEQREDSIDTTDREISATRIFNAPRELVFRAWTEPDHIAQWWGPKGFTNTFYEFDLKPGGRWRFTMHGPDGVNYPNESVFVEIVAFERIVFRHVVPPRFLATATFDEQGNKTLLTWRMLFETSKLRDAVIDKHNAAEGLKQNLDKLGEYLVKM